METVIGVKMHRQKPQRKEQVWKILDLPKNCLKACVGRFELRFNFFTLLDQKPQKLEIYWPVINGLNSLWCIYQLSLQDLLAELHDFAIIAKRLNENKISSEEIKERLRKNGIISCRICENTQLLVDFSHYFL